MATRKNQDSNDPRAISLFSIIANIVTICTGLGVPFSAVWSFVRASWLWAILAAVFFFLTIGFVMVRKHSHRLFSWILGLFSPNLPYSFSSKDVVYEYKDLSNMEFCATYKVKPLQSGVDNIRVRYNWSGATAGFSMTPEPVTDDSNHIYTKKVVFDGKEYGYSYYKVYSTTKHNKNNKDFLVGTRIKLENGENCSHHLLDSIGVKISKLNMKIVLPKDLHPISINFFEFLHSTDDIHWRTETLEAKFDSKLQKWIIERSVDNPIFGGKYLISWGF